jgi:hypothetical protein
LQCAADVTSRMTVQETRPDYGTISDFRKDNLVSME